MNRTEGQFSPVRSWLLLWTTATLLVLSRVLLPTAGLDRTEAVLDATARVCPPYRNSGNPERIPWAVTGVSSRLPFSVTCLMQALVGQALFDARGHRSDVRLGVTKDDEELRAHAWVERNGDVVIGELDDLSEFQPIDDSGDLW